MLKPQNKVEWIHAMLTQILKIRTVSVEWRDWAEYECGYKKRCIQIVYAVYGDKETRNAPWLKCYVQMFAVCTDALRVKMALNDTRYHESLHVM